MINYDRPIFKELRTASMEAEFPDCTPESSTPLSSDIKMKFWSVSASFGPVWRAIGRFQKARHNPSGADLFSFGLKEDDKNH